MKKIILNSLILSLLVLSACQSSQSQSNSNDTSGNALANLDFRRVIQQSKDKVYPAVVYIRCLRRSMESGKAITGAVTGSGVLISSDGQLLTNWHVVDKSVEVRCLLYDGKAYEAEVIGSDKDIDLALLQLKLPKEHKPLPFAEIGDSSKLVEGDFVMAMGAPLGLARSVSMGIVSCTSRYLPTNSQYSLWLQTDAAINPGNSGGPLVNTDGQIIGINTLGMSSGGGMGFSVPSQTIKQILQRLRQNNDVNWTWLGLQLQPLRDFNKNVYFDATEGVIIAGTDPESPARRAGILERDRIISINGIKVTGTVIEDLPDIRRMIGLLPVDKPIQIELVREDQTKSFSVLPRDKGKVEGTEFDCPRWDMTVKTINQFDNPNLYYYKKQGVFIFGVKYPGNASNANLNEKDIIVKIDKEKVATLEDIKRIHKRLIADVKEKHRVLVVVLRNGNMRQIILDFSRDYERE